MGIHYKWTDYYQNKVLNDAQVINILANKGMKITVDMLVLKIVVVESFDKIKKWNIENLSDMWTTIFMVDQNDSSKMIVKVFFTNEEDAIAFKLRWT